MKLRQFALFALIPLLAVLITWGTGFVTLYANGLGPEYGFPLPWKTVELVPTCYMCPLPTSYDWGFFTLDVMFYTLIGYGIFFLRTRTILKEQDQKLS